MKLLVVVLLFLWTLALSAQTLEQPSLGSGGVEPVKTLPAWAYILGAGGMNSALLALKRFAPFIPGWAGPLINVGLVLGGTYLGLGQDVQSAVLNTGVISGGAAVTHNVIKNVSRGDTLGGRKPPR